MDKQFVIELDDVTYSLSDKTLKIIETPQSTDQAKFLVTDFENAVSRVMHVESEMKYAETLVIRRLQNEGEFDEPVSVLTHWKKKRGKNTTEIFFTALPSRVYLKYLDKLEDHDTLIMIFPIFSILANAVQQLSEKDAVAVVFRHSRFADLVIGKDNYFFFATKCVAAGDIFPQKRVITHSNNRVDDIKIVLKKRVQHRCPVAGAAPKKNISCGIMMPGKPYQKLFGMTTNSRPFVGFPLTEYVNDTGWILKPLNTRRISG